MLALEKLDTVFNAVIDLVVIGTDSNVQEDYSDAIKRTATAKGVKFCFKDDATIKESNSTYHIALGWKWLIDVNGSQQLIVFHDSLLPQYRGFNPLVTQLINGDEKIGATCFLGAIDYDTGPIIFQKEITVNYPLKINEAIDKIAMIYADLLNAVVNLIHEGKEIVSHPQNEANATYSIWRDEQDYLINWSKDAAYLQRFINAVGYPYKAAFFYFKDKKIRVAEAAVVEDVIIVNRDTGKVFKKNDGNPIIICGTGLLELKKMFDENGNEFTIDLFRVRL